MSDGDAHVVIGAGGGIGAAVVRELLSRELPTVAVSRGGDAGPGGAERRRADAATTEGAIEACRGACVVYHCAQPPYTRWAQDLPPLTEAILLGARSAGGKLVMADNLYSYGHVSGPITEETPRAATGKKGRVRIAMEERLLSAHQAGEARVAIGRASDYYGPGGRGSTAGDQVFGRIAAGKKPRWLGAPDQPHTLNYLGDVARGLVTLGLEETADGQVWHLPAAEPLTGRAFCSLACEAMGAPPSVSVTPPAMIRLLGVFSPLIRELGETSYQFTAPFVSDTSRFQQAFGPLEPTPHGEAVRTTADWFRSQSG
ncbi:MAG: NAD-dependent epimerase/dehydratase family protein [Solirubrobacterales bacterium]